MIDEVMVFRMIRYFAVLTFEYYDTQKLLSDKFNMPKPPDYTIDEIFRNICGDFGLDPDNVLAHSEMEKHDKDRLL